MPQVWGYSRGTPLTRGNPGVNDAALPLPVIVQKGIPGASRVPYIGWLSDEFATKHSGSAFQVYLK
jgi:hypothetical protein